MVYQLSTKFGNNSVGHENLKLDVEYNLFVASRTLQIESGLASFICGLSFSVILSKGKLL